MTATKFAIAVFPFLKTSGRVEIGGHLFRSTDDVDGLPPDQEVAVGEISQMLFVQNNLRVKSASYAILPGLEVHSGNPQLDRLAQLRDVVAYFYSAPHPIFEDVFLSPAAVSLALFSPSRVSVFLTRPEHHTESIEPPSGPEPDQFHYVPGYNGLYNFQHSFWVEPGDRVYGPQPHMTLNISQDLYADIEQLLIDQPGGHKSLFGLLTKPVTPTTLRVFSALHWYNAANERGLDPNQAILNLAVAFETLLRLPESSKTERLVDAISLLLGRTDRLKEWAGQFYDARSQAVHEGTVRNRYFYARDTEKGRVSDIFGSLMLYGRHIFQLCLETLLFGAEQAERIKLEERFVTNNERYQNICEVLKKTTGTPNERLLELENIVNALERYQFVASHIDAGPRLAAVQLAAATLMECKPGLPPDLADAIAALGTVQRKASELQRLGALEVVADALKKHELASFSPEVQIVRNIIHLAWMGLFQRYYWLKDQQGEKDAAD